MNCAKCNRILDGEDVGGYNLMDEPVCFPCVEKIRKVASNEAFDNPHHGHRDED